MMFGSLIRSLSQNSVQNHHNQQQRLWRMGGGDGRSHSGYCPIG